ncbi:iron-sulfur cluster repair di-iron protein [Elizabethkingia meningoseptica]|uniref:iron-sulfur cluster repair di-iron protein n=1 Tax=Elizabethkingia meningoseptica TaxID=238 RepID=UPI000B35C507|nr:iron-sulfur cluster repair di-iron protein [Elizabethkingia meningoseptica]MDE5437337.1 iron-sulfur cluster repair di-iron protein [Elizabethkingia meningoseptica]MDE5510438.1 iron-sulfur cluster repair di-iron protein [Elizabethkingia meningoseptica]MDE5514154.1 iron-sulfur cluster repair di-iron protein [Elizabethkingia meningoseptica]MDE5524802.1 iron-sulfur cluster repair di-iron protein [Elizabethkingia meningoseptica]MDE5528365.1 iron-sulfur cluster repair di-iron protein [Elizabethki
MNTQTDLIGAIVAEDFRTAAVFKKYGIDFCCKGGRTIAEACEKKGIDEHKVYEEIENLPDKEGGAIDFTSWPLDLLADYVEKTHHRYVEEKTPVLQAFLDKLCKVHGDRHPELFDIRELFDESAKDLAAHMKKEELILFPFVRNMIKARHSGESLLQPHFGTVENPVNMMKHEHTAEGERFEKIAKLTDNYTPPADACNTYKVAFAMLQDFENDLHTHIHLENNILFPKSIQLEKEFSAV